MHCSDEREKSALTFLVIPVLPLPTYPYGKDDLACFAIVFVIRYPKLLACSCAVPLHGVGRGFGDLEEGCACVGLFYNGGCEVDG